MPWLESSMELDSCLPSRCYECRVRLDLPWPRYPDWTHVQEMEDMESMMPFIRRRWDAEWHPRIACVDASLWGAGVVSRAAPVEEVAGAPKVVPPVEHHHDSQPLKEHEVQSGQFHSVDLNFQY